MYEDIVIHLQSKNIVLNTSKILGDAVNNFHPLLEKLFKSKEGIKPVLILDNVHFISNPHDIRTIVELAKKWKEVILILVGDTMDNALLEDFHEFPLGPWGRQT